MLAEFYKEYNKERIIKIALKINILQWFLKITHFPLFGPFYSNGRGYNPQNQYQPSFHGYKHYVKIS